MIEKADLQNKTVLHIDSKTSISCFILIYGQYQVISHPTTLSLKESRNSIIYLLFFCLWQGESIRSLDDDCLIYIARDDFHYKATWWSLKPQECSDYFSSYTNLNKLVPTRICTFVLIHSDVISENVNGKLLFITCSSFAVSESIRRATSISWISPTVFMFFTFSAVFSASA